MENNKYLLSIMIAKRVKELKAGAKPLVQSKNKKPIIIALEEIKAGKVFIKEKKEALKAEEIFNGEEKPEDSLNEVEKPAKVEDVSDEVKEPGKSEVISNEDEKPAKVEDVSDEVKEPGKSEVISNEDEKPAKVEEIFDEDKEPGKSEGLLND
jgi:DNA-directed RNA polymerase omega subunit